MTQQITMKEYEKLAALTLDYCAPDLGLVARPVVRWVETDEPATELHNVVNWGKVYELHIPEGMSPAATILITAYGAHLLQRAQQYNQPRTDQEEAMAHANAIQYARQVLAAVEQDEGE